MSRYVVELAVGLSVFVLSSSAAPAAWGQDPGAAPISGVIDLAAGFLPDPVVRQVRAGGTINANTIGGTCNGYISNAPDINLNYSAGAMPLIISVDAAADTTLVVNGADGSWYCDDDSGPTGSNPMIRLNKPASGRYDIWVGTYSAGATQPARLHVSELSAAMPEPARAQPTPARPVSPPPPRQQSPGLTAAVGERVVPAIVYFGFEDPSLPDRERQSLDAFVEAYRVTGESAVVVSGHIDRAEANASLAQQRANVVRDYLVSMGIPAGMITVQSYGEQRPAVDTPDGTRDPDNRRVEVTAGPGSGW